MFQNVKAHHPRVYAGVGLCNKREKNKKSQPQKIKTFVMKSSKFLNVKKLSTVLLLAAISLPATLFAQAKYRVQSATITLAGTSTLHDWTMKASQANSDAVFQVGANDKISDLTNLSFTMPAKGLKSEHAMMDNNTYKALDIDKNPNISFVLSNADITPVDATTYNIKAKGRLTIAGTTKETDLVATGKFNPADKSLQVTGAKKFKMTDYGVKPPTVMFGSIKTGDDITVSYNLKFIK
jgi:polyisoprenoid-binding protein YceI